MVGKRLDELITPYLILDLNAAQANLIDAVAFLTAKDKKLRPHFKVHRSPALARWQLDCGAKGITCARLDEMEALLKEGIDEVLLANTFSGRPKCRYAAHLANEGQKALFVLDHLETATILDEEAQKANTTVRYLIDLDLGMNRSGLSGTQAAWTFYQSLCRLSNLRFAGLMGYEGHVVALPNGAEKDAKINQALAKLAHAVQEFRTRGIDVPIVSAGGTGSFPVTVEAAEVTEIQMGTFFLMDELFANIGVTFRRAAFIVSRVVYRKDDRVVLDCGMKGMHPQGPASVRDDPNLRIEKLNAEHSICRLVMPTNSYQVGDVVCLNIPYADGTFNLYSNFLGVRNGRVEKIFPCLSGGL